MQAQFKTLRPPGPKEKENRTDTGNRAQAAPARRKKQSRIKK